MAQDEVCQIAARVDALEQVVMETNLRIVKLCALLEDVTARIELHTNLYRAMMMDDDDEPLILN